MTDLYPSSGTPPTPEPAPARLSGSRRAIASALLAVGLFAVGGTAIVLAADPSASPAPSTTTQPSTGDDGTSGSGGTATPPARAGHAKGDCPNMDGSGGSGSSGDPGSQPAPATPGSTATPSV